ncbi:MAG TPA: tRNA 2-selenouridine(34) synthase MnmH [Saprospiraceae bacterium]|nr:tRNA 2-selenouridine(34) synthase MnmH [Saprospiraceae bacterium]
MQKITPADMLAQKSQLPLLDVRTPAEYERGHIPGAINFPLFSNEERVIIGTLYKKKGKNLAVEKGLELVGPKLAQFVKSAKKLAVNQEIMLHCWRGGMRSGSMAWLFETAGLRPKVLQGGYKAYRQLVHRDFSERKLPLKVLSGATGSGKTIILHEMAKQGHQVIDLEKLANHKGSSFGAIGEDPQPVTEHFENLLHQRILELDPSRPVWIENESRGIGSVYIPQGFWEQMQTAPLINISIPQKNRLDILTQIYTGEDPALLQAAFERIKKKLGGQNLKKALQALQEGDYHTAAEIALYYYDKAYAYGLEKNKSRSIEMIDFDYFEADKMAQVLTLAGQAEN